MSWPQPKSQIERFERLVSIEQITGCWIWMGALLPPWMYGRLTENRQGIGRRSVLAHRYAYEVYRHPIPDGLTLDHLCRHPWCVNPYHLEPVTMRENTLRGTSVPAMNARKTHCSRGHAFDATNTKRITNGNGKPGRRCRKCDAALAASRVRQPRRA